MNFFQKILKKVKKNRPMATIIPNDDKYRILLDNDKNPRLVPRSKWKPNMSNSEIKSFPLINEPFATSNVIVHPFGTQPEINYDTLWTYFKYTPEVMACVRAIVEDIMSDGYVIETIDKSISGRNKKLKAERFLLENYAQEQIISMLYDLLITGDGYFYAQRFSKQEIKGRIDNILSKPEFKSILPEEMKSDMSQKIFNNLEHDEDLFTARSFIQVPSSTLKAHFDKNGNVIKWVQKVGMRYQTYNREEIIHFRLLRLDGRFYGFTPLMSIMREMDILANVKDFARYFFEKGGVPNFMFILKNETPKSENYKIFKKTLQLYSSVANKFKSMVVTGEVETVPLNKLNRDMEFRELAKYLSQILIMAWGVPVSRLSDVGFGDKSMRGTTNTTEGYYRKIRHMQDQLQNMINMELLKPFGVRIRFNRQHIQDLLRKVQVDKIQTDTVEQRMRLGLFSREQAAEYLDLDPNDLPNEEEIKKLNELISKTGLLEQEKLNKMQTLTESPEKIGQANDKQSIALEKKSKPFIIKDLGNKKFKIEVDE